MSRLVRAVLCLAVALGAAPLLSTAQDSTDLLKPNNPPIVFFWDDALTTSQRDALPACTSVTMTLYSNPSTTLKPQSPFYMIAIPVGGVPVAQYGGEAILDEFTFVPRFPQGTVFSIAMVDSNGLSGGAVGTYTIDGNLGNCTILDTQSSSPSFSLSPTDRPCNELMFTVTGGVAPYTASFITPVGGTYANLTNITTDTFLAENIIAQGQDFSVYITDSTGASTNASSMITSALGASNCNLPDGVSNGNDGADVGAIAGGVVGGVLGVALLILLAWCLFKRQRRRGREDESVHGDVGEAEDYRQADGSMARITPFIVTPSNDAETEKGAADISGSSSGDQMHPGDGMHSPAYWSNSGGVQSHTLPASPHSYAPYEGHAQDPYAGYGGAPGGQEATSNAASGRPGAALANPDEFAYRSAPSSPPATMTSHPAYSQQQPSYGAYGTQGVSPFQPQAYESSEPSRPMYR